MSGTLAIVGAGAAGAGAAYALRESAVEVTVFEKSGGVCGRAATRRRGECTYEYGANYLTDDDERVADLVTGALPDQGLVDVSDPVWTFDGDGEVSEGHGEAGRKWTYEAGITQLAKRLFAESEATVHRNTRVEAMERIDEQWRIEHPGGDTTVDAVLLTPPAPQTADLLGAAHWRHGDCRWLRQRVEQVPFRTIIAVVCHYERALDRPYYALVNEDEAHDIGWVGREECKPGHVPDGETLLLVQMAPDWSAEHYHDDAVAVVDAVSDKTAALLGADWLADPNWTDHQHWRYALPDAGVDEAVLERGREHDLFFAGDWVAGEARLHAALRSGLEAGEQVAGHL